MSHDDKTVENPAVPPKFYEEANQEYSRYLNEERLKKSIACEIEQILRLQNEKSIDISAIIESQIKKLEKDLKAELLSSYLNSERMLGRLSTLRETIHSFSIQLDHNISVIEGAIDKLKGKDVKLMQDSSKMKEQLKCIKASYLSKLEINCELILKGLYLSKLSIYSKPVIFEEKEAKSESQNRHLESSESLKLAWLKSGNEDEITSALLNLYELNGEVRMPEYVYNVLKKAIANGKQKKYESVSQYVGEIAYQITLQVTFEERIAKVASSLLMEEFQLPPYEKGEKRLEEQIKNILTDNLIVHQAIYEIFVEEWDFLDKHKEDMKNRLAQCWDPLKLSSRLENMEKCRKKIQQVGETKKKSVSDCVDWLIEKAFKASSIALDEEKLPALELAYPIASDEKELPVLKIAYPKRSEGGFPFWKPAASLPASSLLALLPEEQEYIF